VFFCHSFGRLKALTKLAWESFFTKENDYELFLAEIKERNYIAYFSQLARLTLYLLATARKSNADSFL